MNDVTRLEEFRIERIIIGIEKVISGLDERYPLKKKVFQYVFNTKNS
jgi:hypothetical protein